MAASSTVSTGDIATAAQYNNLRTDVLDTSSGHTHNGTDSNDLGTLTADLTLSKAGATQVEIISTTNDAYLILNSDTDEGQDSEVVFESGGTARGRIEYNHHATANSQLMSLFTADNAVESLRLQGNLATFATAVDLGSNTLTSTGSMQIRTIDYSDGDLAMTIADGGSVTFAQDTFITDGMGLVIGHTAQIATEATPETQVLGTGSADSSLLIAGFGSNIPPRIHFVSSDAAIGSHDILEDNDLIGELRYYPDDGVDYATRAASFYVEVDDASPEAGGVGTAFVWKQMPGGGTTAAHETMRIGANGMMTLGGAVARDSGIILDGNAQDFHMGLEDAQDDFVIGTGSTLGTNPIIMMNEQLCIGFGESPAVAPRIRIYPHTTADYDDSATFLDGAAGQTNTITGNQDANFGWNFRNYTLAGDSGTRTVAEGATVYIPDAITVGSNAAVTNNYALWVDAGDSRFDGDITIQTAGNGNRPYYTAYMYSDTAADRPYLSFRRSNNDTEGTLTAMTDGDYVGSINFLGIDSGGNWDAGASIDVVHSGSVGTKVPVTMTLATHSSTATNTDQLVLDSTGAVFIGDNANGFMTTGLTINQGAADNEILALKSSDVSHNTQHATNGAEADTFGQFKKREGPGGLLVAGFLGGSASNNIGVTIRSVTEDEPSTNKSTSAYGSIQLHSNIDDGGGTGNVSAIGADGNLVSIDNAGTVRFIFDAEGSGHADVEWTTYSDERLKSNQQPLTYGMNEIKQLQPKSYIRDHGSVTDGVVALENNSYNHIGFIAQEVKEVIPEIVKDVDESNSFYSLDDGKLMAVVVKALQEIDNRLLALEGA